MATQLPNVSALFNDYEDAEIDGLCGWIVGKEGLYGSPACPAIRRQGLDLRSAAMAAPAKGKPCAVPASPMDSSDYHSGMSRCPSADHLVPDVDSPQSNWAPHHQGPPRYSTKVLPPKPKAPATKVAAAAPLLRGVTAAGKRSREALRLAAAWTRLATQRDPVTPASPMDGCGAADAAVPRSVGSIAAAGAWAGEASPFSASSLSPFAPGADSLPYAPEEREPHTSRPRLHQAEHAMMLSYATVPEWEPAADAQQAAAGDDADRAAADWIAGYFDTVWPSAPMATPPGSRPGFARQPSGARPTACAAAAAAAFNPLPEASSFAVPSAGWADEDEDASSRFCDDAHYPFTAAPLPPVEALLG